MTPQVLTFGKHKDLTFEQVKEKDPGYCNWVRKLPSPSGELKRLQEFLRGNGAASAGAGGGASAAPAAGAGFVRPVQAVAGLPADRSLARHPGLARPVPTATTSQSSQSQSHPADAGRRREASQDFRQLQQDKRPRNGKEALCLELLSQSEFRIFSPHFLDSRLWHLVTGLKLGEWNSERRHWIFPADTFDEVVSKLENHPTLVGCGLELPPEWAIRRLPCYSQGRSRTLRLGGQLRSSTSESTRRPSSSASGSQAQAPAGADPGVLQALPQKTRERLMPYQREGVLFGIARAGRCLIGDEMGLGKTLQALGIIAYFKDSWPCLVIVPSSMRFIWRDQIAEWLELEQTDVQVLKNGKEQVNDQARFVVVSFNLIARQEHFQQRAGGGFYQSIIVDESQFVKEYKSQRCKATLAVCRSAKRVILLSGTPALNRAAELYTQLDALMPGEIPSFLAFAKRYCEQVTQHFKGREVVKWTGSRCKSELNLLLSSSIMIRRLKKDVLTQLPDKTRQRLVLDTSQMDKQVLKQLEQKMKELEELGDEQKAVKEVKAVEVSDVDGNDAAAAAERKAKAKAFTSMSELFRLSAEAKVGAVLEHVETLLEADVKFLCFAHHNFMMDKIEENLKSKKVGYIRIDGGTAQEQRPELVDQFQNQEDTRVAVLSITACGQGLTLTAASHVVFSELYWVPGQLLQAEDRVHRLGQKNPCVIQYLIAPKTMDDRIFRLVDRKTCVVTGILDGVERGINVEPDAKEKEKEVTTQVEAASQDDDPLINLMGQESTCQGTAPQEAASHCVDDGNAPEPDKPRQSQSKASTPMPIKAAPGAEEAPEPKPPEIEASSPMEAAQGGDDTPGAEACQIKAEAGTPIEAAADDRRDPQQEDTPPEATTSTAPCKGVEDHPAAMAMSAREEDARYMATDVPPLAAAQTLVAAGDADAIPGGAHNVPAQEPGADLCEETDVALPSKRLRVTQTQEDEGTQRGVPAAEKKNEDPAAEENNEEVQGGPASGEDAQQLDGHQMQVTAGCEEAQAPEAVACVATPLSKRRRVDGTEVSPPAGLSTTVRGRGQGSARPKETGKAAINAPQPNARVGARPTAVARAPSLPSQQGGRMGKDARSQGPAVVHHHLGGMQRPPASPAGPTSARRPPGACSSPLLAKSPALGAAAQGSSAVPGKRTLGQRLGAVGIGR